MNNTVIQVEKLGKYYQIGSAKDRNRTFRDAITDMVTAPWRSMKRAFLQHQVETDNKDNNIWALKDVSFQVNRGEVVGIIGRNGAGKSTLLKILSRITEPTEGRVILRGRVGSLLEVGTGFHSELTGEENIYLSGTILGMSSREISNKFDEIVAFAEIKKFMNTPVKYYSSGMYMRLAFAVAAHLEPEILLIDEVLAVGDAEFQKKCLGKMGDVAKEGRTVLFVSHNMAAVQRLCDTVFCLEYGNVVESGDPFTVISHYNQRTMAAEKVNLEKVHRIGSGKAKFVSVRTINESGSDCDSLSMGEALIVEMKVESQVVSRIQLSVEINNSYGQTVIHAVDQDDSFEAMCMDGVFQVRATFPTLYIYPGQYILGVWCGYQGENYDYIRDCLKIYIEQAAVSGRTTPMRQEKAIFFSPSIWRNVQSAFP